MKLNNFLLASVMVGVSALTQLSPSAAMEEDKGTTLPVKKQANKQSSDIIIKNKTELPLQVKLGLTATYGPSQEAIQEAINYPSNKWWGGVNYSPVLCFSTNFELDNRIEINSHLTLSREFIDKTFCKQENDYLAELSDWPDFQERTRARHVSLSFPAHLSVAKLTEEATSEATADASYQEFSDFKSYARKLKIVETGGSERPFDLEIEY